MRAPSLHIITGRIVQHAGNFVAFAWSLPNGQPAIITGPVVHDLIPDPRVGDTVTLTIQVTPKPSEPVRAKPDQRGAPSRPGAA